MSDKIDKEGTSVDITSDTITTSAPIMNPTYGYTIAPNTTPGYYVHPQQQPLGPSFPQPTSNGTAPMYVSDPFAALPVVEGLDELAEMLGVDGNGPMPHLIGVSGVRYSLVNILRAQMEFMARLNILLVHRKLVPEQE